MAIDYDKLKNRKFADIEQAYGVKDTMLYALGLGLGFGLQAIAANFVSGFVLLMDKSIKPGDVISFTGGSREAGFDGKGNDGTQWPAGDYKMTVSAKDSNGKDVSVSTEVQGTVDSVDLTASPALLSIGGKNYTLDQIKRVVKGTSST